MAPALDPNSGALPLFLDSNRRDRYRLEAHTSSVLALEPITFRLRLRARISERIRLYCRRAEPKS